MAYSTAILTTLILLITVTGTAGFITKSNVPSRRATTCFMSLKPAAIPLMDSGKALARSGEFLIDVTTGLELYGGGLSAAGAAIRNAGDCVAQAAASCRFKTAGELVSDELREASTCLIEARDKLKLAVDEAKSDNDDKLTAQIAKAVVSMALCAETLEAAGAGIMQQRPLGEIGGKLVECGEKLLVLALQILELAPDLEDCKMSCQRMTFASERMIVAGNELKGTPKPKAKGKSWLKA